MSDHNDLVCATREVATELKAILEWFKSHHGVATKQDLKETENKIMSAITDWAAKEQADLDTISATLDGIVAGVAALDTLITNLQNSPGTLSAADQAALDAIQAASKTLVTKSGAISTAPPTVTPPPAP